MFDYMSHTQAYSFQVNFIFIIYLTFFLSHYFFILHIPLHDKVCRLHNFVILVILNLIFGAAFITVLFTCFINVIVYFISISEYFVTIISPELCVLNLKKFFQPHFDCKNTQAYTFSWGFYQLWSTDLHLHHLCHMLFQMFHVNMLFINIYLELMIHVNGLFKVHFHIV